MKKRIENKLLLGIRISIWVMITGLVLSGLSAFPLQTETDWLISHSHALPETMYTWLQIIHTAIVNTNRDYPYLCYGTDWLAFAHLMLAILFFGPLKKPVENVWVIQFGMIACACIIPLAFIAGSIREIPVFWRIIDCSFGVIGIVPLIISYRNIARLKHIREYAFIHTPNGR